VRLFAETRLAPEGESVAVYDNCDEIFPEPHVVIIKPKRIVLDVDQSDATALASAVSFRLESRKSALGFAFRVAGDQSGTRFVIIAGIDDSYRVVYERKTLMGKLRIFEGNPTRIEVWSADTSLDSPVPGESCVWCPHYYRVTRLVWRGQRFVPTGERITRNPLDPGYITAEPFAKGK